jgi:hypothetical protein
VTSANHQRILYLLKRFVANEERSLNLAGELEGELARVFPEDERFEDLIDALAAYRPGGGEYLYDDERIATKCNWVISQLESE